MWVNKGEIFQVRNYQELFPELTYAQSPQAIQLDGFVRIFFTTRVKRDLETKWVSVPMFVDFDETLTRALRPPQFVDIEEAKLGAFDEHGIFPFSPTKVGDEVWAYTTGWSRRTSVSVETGIGLMKSKDSGLSFQRVGIGPVLSSSLFEPFLVCDGYVRQLGEEWYMWYLYGTDWKTESSSSDVERTYKIGLATSIDGVNWKPSNATQLIPDVLGDNESQALPTVISSNDGFEMYFCYRESFDFRSNPARGYRLGYAYSSNANEWSRHDEELNFERQDWDSDMRCYPSAIEINGAKFLLYNGNRFGESGFGVAQWVP